MTLSSGLGRFTLWVARLSAGGLADDGRMREQGSPTSANRVGRVLLVVAAVFVVASLIFAGVDEVSGGSKSADWVSIAIDVLLLVVLAATLRSSRRG